MSMNIGMTNDQGFTDMVRNDFKRIENGGTSRAETREDLRDTTGKAGGVSEKNEAKLSSKAQNLLKSLRKLYGDYDFFVGNKTDDLKALSKSGSREFSIIFSNDELERMANDANYAKEKIQAMENAVRMSKKISEQQGQLSALVGADGLNGTINRVSIEVDDKGGMKIFAELEKVSEKQRERIEKAREKRAEEKKEAGKEDKEPVKRTTIEADSVEELLAKIRNLDWDKISGERPGERFNYTV